MTYKCLVIGAGVCLPPRGLALFKVVINAVHKAAPDAAIAFNTRREDSADAVAQSLAAGSPGPYDPAFNKNAFRANLRIRSDSPHSGTQALNPS